MGKSSASRSRMSIAAEAARIIATEGFRNYGTAKRKAATRLGYSAQHQALPSNTEIEQALQQHQHLFGGQTHLELQLELQRAALHAIQFFSRFKPRLVGPVLDGTADQNSAISLHLFCEHQDDAVHFLLRHEIEYDQSRRRIRWHEKQYRDIDMINLHHRQQHFELALLHTQDLRQPPPCPVSGKPQRGANQHELEELIGSAETEQMLRNF